MAKKQKNRHAHVGALNDAQKAVKREKWRVRKAVQASKLKAQGLKRPVSAATKANKQLCQRSQRHYVKGERLLGRLTRCAARTSTNGYAATERAATVYCTQEEGSCTEGGRSTAEEDEGSIQEGSIGKVRWPH
jgi:hypothetical protein